MKPRLTIGTGITASAVAHLTVLMLVVYFAEVHPFSPATPESITVDLVTPDEVAPSPTKEPSPIPEELPKAKPSDDFSLALPAPAAPLPTTPATRPQQPATPATPRPGQQKASAPPPTTSPLPPRSQPAYATPEPDLSIKYHVLLGLPPALPRERLVDKAEDVFDAPASRSADVANSLVAEFRRHLKSCARLPESIAPSDKLKIKLRVFLTPDGRFSAEPALIEASASAKGPALMQSAIAALDACQPYQMLPADRYNEWNVLDLSFTPADFAGN